MAKINITCDVCDKETSHKVVNKTKSHYFVKGLKVTCRVCKSNQIISE